MQYRMQFEAAAIADFEDYLTRNRENCKRHFAQIAPLTPATNCAVMPLLLMEHHGTVIDDFIVGRPHTGGRLHIGTVRQQEGGVVICTIEAAIRVSGAVRNHCRILIQWRSGHLNDIVGASICFWKIGLCRALLPLARLPSSSWVPMGAAITV